MNILMIGAHPDDCEVFGGGTAALFSQSGHRVKFISTTNGDAGHHLLRGHELEARRSKETIEAAQVLGVEYEVMANHDGQLIVSLENRHAIIQKIREWQADIVVTHRPNDYHPDHRYTSQIVQDAAYMVMVPNIVSQVAPLRKNPVFMYFQDSFKKPYPFTPGLAFNISSTYEAKIKALHAHDSQFYEWLPWIDGEIDQVPESTDDRIDWLKQIFSASPTKDVRKLLASLYGEEQAKAIKQAEAFEISEYGHQPDKEEIQAILGAVGH